MRLSPLISPLIAAALVASGLAFAHGGDHEGGRARTANLDSDAALERVVPRDLCESADGGLAPPQPECTSDQFARHRIEIEDTCAGKPFAFSVSSVQDFVAQLRVTQADAVTSRPEVFFDIRSGATGRGGEARIVRVHDADEGRCSRADVLFHYPTRAARGPNPRGASGIASWGPDLRDYTRRFRGKEVRVIETYVDRDDAFCCPSFRRFSYFRYSRARDRYVRFTTRVERIRKE